MRTLVAVVLDLADDFGFGCAVAVVDRAGALRGPDGFALEACREAARALGLRRAA